MPDKFEWTDSDVGCSCIVGIIIGAGMVLAMAVIIKILT